MLERAHERSSVRRASKPRRRELRGIADNAQRMFRIIRSIRRFSALFARRMRTTAFSLFAPDIFISYSRTDAWAYATKLANLIESRIPGVDCYLDRRAAPAQRELPASVLRHAGSARLFVLVATTNAVHSRNVRREVVTFSRRPRPAVPISVGGVLSDDIWRRNPWARIGGAQRQPESDSAVEHALPSDDVVDAIVNAVQFATGARRRRIAAIVAAVFVAVATGLSIDQLRRASAATAAADSADRRRATQSVSFESDRLEQEAERARVALQTLVAETRSRLSQLAAAIADIDAAAAARRAADARAQAEHELRRANAARLAGQAMTLIDRSPQVGMLLAAAAFDIVPQEPAYETRAALFRAVTRYAGLRRILAPPPEVRLIGGSIRTPGEVRSLAVRSGSPILVAGSGGGTTSFWDLSTSRWIRPEQTHRSSVLAACISPSARLAATHDEDGHVFVWHVATRTRLRDIAAGVEPDEDEFNVDSPLPFGAVRFISDERLLTKGVPDGATEESLMEWDLTQPGQAPARTVEIASLMSACPATNGAKPCSGSRTKIAEPSGVDFSLDGRMVAIAYGDGRVAVFDWPSGALRRCFHLGQDGVWQVALRGSRVAWTTLGGAAVVADVETGTAVLNECFGSGPGDVALSEDGRRAGFTSDAGKIVIFRDGKLEGTFTYLAPIRSSPSTLVFGDPRGDTIISGTGDDAILVWSANDLAAGAPVNPIATEVIAVPKSISSRLWTRLAFSADGSRLVVGIKSQLLADLAWSVHPRDASAREKEPLHVVDWRSRRRDRLEQLSIRDLATGETRFTHTVPRHAFVVAAARSSDGSMLAAILTYGGKRYELLRWQMPQGRPLPAVPLPQGSSIVALAHDAKTLAFADENGRITVRGADGLTHVIHSDDAIRALALSPRGDMVAATGRASTQLWDVATGLAIGEIGPSPQALAFHPNGRELAAAYADHVTLWNIDPRAWRDMALRVADRDLTDAERARYLAARRPVAE